MISFREDFGVWRSPVAHLLWEQGAGGSNPLTPTISSVQPVPQVPGGVRHGDHPASRGEDPVAPRAQSLFRMAATSGLVVLEPPAWVKGDEWEFRSESPNGRSAFRWTG